MTSRELAVLSSRPSDVAASSQSFLVLMTQWTMPSHSPCIATNSGLTVVPEATVEVVMAVVVVVEVVVVVVVIVVVAVVVVVVVVAVVVVVVVDVNVAVEVVVISVHNPQRTCLSSPIP